MPTAVPNGFVDHLRRGLPADPRADGELVREYAVTGSEAAFAELVRRFTPLVWGVCRRAVHDRQLAEDAFQATFLVLVRKAGSVRPNAVGGWLHAVAVHTSTRARAMADRRKARTRPLADHDPAVSVTEPTDADAVRALDEEVSRLPEALRAAVVLCELDGLSRKDAATRLGIAEGTLSSRLASARKRLAARLRGRGVALAVAFALVSRNADAAPVVASTTSETVSTLADGAVRTMFLSKLKLTAVAVLAVMAGVGPLFAAPPDLKRYQVKAPVKAPAPREGKILFWLDDKPQLLKPDGTELKSPPPDPKSVNGVGWGHAQLSPDSKWIAFERSGGAAKLPPVKPAAPGVAVARNRTTLHLVDTDNKAEPKELAGVHLNGFHWLDGGKLHVRGYEIGEDDTVSSKLEDWVYDPATDKRTPMKVPDTFVIRAVGPDGKTAVADEWKMTDTEWHQHAHLWTIGSDKKPTPLLELNQSFDNLKPQFSPDGKRLLCKVSHYATWTPLGNGSFRNSDFKFHHLLVIDLATKKQTVVKELGENPEWRVGGFAWSPDGKQVAYVESKPLPRAPGQRRDNDPFRVTVADADGKNAKEIYTATGSWLLGFDWK